MLPESVSRRIANRLARSMEPAPVQPASGGRVLLSKVETEAEELDFGLHVLRAASGLLRSATRYYRMRLTGEALDLEEAPEAVFETGTLLRDLAKHWDTFRFVDLLKKYQPVIECRAEESMASSIWGVARGELGEAGILLSFVDEAEDPEFARLAGRVLGLWKPVSSREAELLCLKQVYRRYVEELPLPPFNADSVSMDFAALFDVLAEVCRGGLLDEPSGRLIEEMGRGANQTEEALRWIQGLTGEDEAAIRSIFAWRLEEPEEEPPEPPSGGKSRTAPPPSSPPAPPDPKQPCPHGVPPDRQQYYPWLACPRCCRINLAWECWVMDLVNRRAEQSPGPGPIRR